MKKFLTLALAALSFFGAATAANNKKKADPKDTLVFTTIVSAPVTSIKNQNNSGTCWAYSSLAFLESEEPLVETRRCGSLRIVCCSQNLQ